MFIIKVIIYVNKLEGRKILCFGQEEIFVWWTSLEKQTKWVEIELIYNVKIIIRLCFIIWNNMIENEKINTWYQCLMFWPHESLGRKILENVHVWT
jgi:hypothetical protein